MKIKVILSCLILAGCSAKTVYVPVIAECPKPKLQAPHDYMSDLTQNSTHQQFIKACLATRESYKTAYESCVSYHGADNDTK